MEYGRKENNLKRNHERSESLSPGLAVVPLLSEAVFLPPSVFSQRSNPPPPNTSDTFAVSLPPD